MFEIKLPTNYSQTNHIYIYIYINRFWYWITHDSWYAIKHQPTIQSCLFIYSFCASLLYPHKLWMIVLFLSIHRPLWLCCIAEKDNNIDAWKYNLLLSFPLITQNVWTGKGERESRKRLSLHTQGQTVRIFCEISLLFSCLGRNLPCHIILQTPTQTHVVTSHFSCYLHVARGHVRKLTNTLEADTIKQMDERKILKGVSQENEKTTRNQTIDQKSHQRDKDGNPPSQIRGTVFEVNGGGTSTNRSENKKTNDVAKGLISQG